MDCLEMVRFVWKVNPEVLYCSVTVCLCSVLLVLLHSIGSSFNGCINTLQPGYSLRTFTGHSTTVMSLDFHPTKEDLICSCDNNNEIRYWSIKNGSCVSVFKV